MSENFPTTVILSPVFNDWKAYFLLLGKLDTVLQEKHLTVTVLAINDGSPLSPEDCVESWGSYSAIQRVEILHLRQNVGHQRAISLGLSWLAAQRPEVQEVVIMDADGEDAPEDVPLLLQRCREEKHRKIVMAIRSKRSETFLFRLCYLIFRFLFHFLTGKRYQMGNFSVIPRCAMETLVGNSGLWCHYAATVFRSRCPYVGVETYRAKRLDGKSQMNFVGLVMHGLSAVSVYLDVASVRMMLLCVWVTLFLGLGTLGILGVHLFIPLPVPGWIWGLLGWTLVLIVQFFTIATILTFITLGNRQSKTFLPIREYPFYIARLQSIVPGQANEKILDEKQG
ncbi:MAG: glycosyltransferase [Planctomycetia bacterium]|nr:glycosyltransferase [Planctomycetia bacterium]